MTGKNSACNNLLRWQRGVVASINEVALHWVRLLLGWVTVCGRVNDLDVYPAISVNSAFHPSGVGKSVACPAGVKVGRVLWQVTLCHPVWQVTTRSSEMTCSRELYRLSFMLTTSVILRPKVSAWCPGLD